MDNLICCGNEIKELDLGIVDAGESKDFVYYLYNETNGLLEELDIKVDHPEVKLKKIPKAVESKESEEIVLTWNPSVTVKRGLKTTLSIKGSEVYR